jgi:hypothetical protein
MAKDKSKKKADKAPGLFAQFGEQVRFLREADTKALPIGILVGIGVFLTISVVGAIISNLNFLGIALWVILGIASGYLTCLLVLTRRANTAIFKKYESEPGRVSITVGTLTRRTYKGSNQPVAINPKTKDMVFRIVGPAGVVLMGEGAKTSTKALLEDERRKVQRVASGVSVHTFYSSQDGEGVPLVQLHKKVKQLKRTLNRAEIAAVQNRLSALDTRFGMPIPKGIDPAKMRASKRIQ